MTLAGGIFCLLAGFALSLWQGGRNSIALTAGLLMGIGISLIALRPGTLTVLDALPLERRIPPVGRIVFFALLWPALGVAWVLLGLAVERYLPFVFYVLGPAPGTNLRFFLAAMYVGYSVPFISAVCWVLLRRSSP